ncbi:MAG: membrane protein insertase YidC, partial [Caldiserica bacterium]|nr:membrane protein insertase YidC [Caldisericota bacterium]
MKRILKALLVATVVFLSIMPVMAQDKLAVSVNGELVINGEGKIKVTLLNISKDKIANGKVELVSIDGIVLDEKGVYSYKAGTQTVVNLPELAPSANFVAEFSVKTNNTSSEGQKPVVVKVSADNIDGIESTGIIDIKKTSTQPDWNVEFSADKETDTNIIFDYIITIKNPKQNNISMSMENVKLELLDINGVKLAVFDKKTADTSKDFGYVYLTDPTKANSVQEIGKIEGDKEISVHMKLVTGPNMEKDKEFVSKFRLSWENSDGSQKYERVFEGKIKTATTAWYLMGFRWIFDFLARNIGFGSYAFAIIVFSILLKLALLPLTNSQFTNMAKIAKIQPQIKALNDKFPGQKEQIQQETMRIYKENNVNVFSSCLPMLVQLPVLFILYSAISGYAPMSYSSFFWIPSLSYPDALFGVMGGYAIGIMPFVMAASTWFQQRIATMPGQDQQNMALQVFFPLLIGWMSMGFASS